MSKDDYAVGYGKPPKETQFQKGRSGNPKGRPKGSQNLAVMVRRIAARPITITEGGRKKSVSLKEAVLLKLCEQALSGNHRAMQMLIKLSQAADDADLADGLSQQLGDAAKVEIVRDFQRRCVAASFEKAAGNAQKIEEKPINVID